MHEIHNTNNRDKLNIIRWLKVWFNRHLSHPEAILLLITIALITGFVITFGHTLAPVLISLVFSYLLSWVMNFMNKHGINERISFILVYSAFIGLFIVTFMLVMPIMWKEAINLLQEIPTMTQEMRERLMLVYQDYMHQPYLNADVMKNISAELANQLNAITKTILTSSLSSIPTVVTWAVYILLIPILVFFMLKDRKTLTGWLGSFFPKNKGMLSEVWFEINDQISNYISGKLLEILIISVISYIIFAWYGLNYAVLLAVLSGLSVLIPYIGVVVVCVPIFLVAFLQFGVSSEFTSLAVAFVILQFIDGNVLVPILFSEAVNLHPISIIIAVLFFGGIWGFWGVFFAIPLATVIKAVFNAWPSLKKTQIKA